MFDRAVLEFREVLAEEPGRLDILVALAEALWRDRQFGEARAVCQRILADSPDCLKGNIIMGHILYLRGDQDSAGKFLSRAQALDPENSRVAQVLDGMDIEAQLKYSDVELPLFEEAEDSWGTPEVASNTPKTGEEALDDALVESSGIAEMLDAAGLDFLKAEPDFVEVDALETYSSEPSSSSIEGASYLDPWPSLESSTSFERAAVEDEFFGLDATSITTNSGIPHDQDRNEEIEIEEIDGANIAVEKPAAIEMADLGAFVEDSARPERRIDRTERDASLRAGFVTPEPRNPVPAEEITAPADHSIGAEKVTEDYTQIYLQKVQAHPEDFQAHLDLALAYHRSSQDDLAVAEFELVLKSSPDLVDRVIEGLRSLLSSNPNHMLAHRRLGDAYMKVGRFQEAIDCYNLCLNKQKTVGPTTSRH
jgi:tetratricopeptide (TPR) repeat protein